MTDQERADITAADLIELRSIFKNVYRCIVGRELDESVYHPSPMRRAASEIIQTHQRLKGMK